MDEYKKENCGDLNDLKIELKNFSNGVGGSFTREFILDGVTTKQACFFHLSEEETWELIDAIIQMNE
jgi:hypothetical protein